MCHLTGTGILLHLYLPLVHGQNQVIITSDPVLPAPLGDTLTLTCNVNVTGVTSIMWTTGGITGTSNQPRTNLSAGTSTFTIPSVLSADLGEYSCRVTTGDSFFIDKITVTTKSG